VAAFTAAAVRAIADRPTQLAFRDQPASHGMVATAPTSAPATGQTGGSAPRASGYGAWFGSIPDMAGGPAKGVLFSGVSTGSPAEKAGLKAGDVLVRIGDNEITDLQAMTDVLRTFRPGDSTTVVVLRDGQELSVPLTFAARNR
jgi:S1-C subfamily serine protease